MADDIPIFDPNQPSEDAAPVFDPSQPSQDVTPKFDPNQPSQDVAADGPFSVRHMVKAVASSPMVESYTHAIPDTWDAVKGGLYQANDYLNPFSAGYDKRMRERYEANKNKPWYDPTPAVEGLTDPIKGALGAVGGTVGAIPSGVAKSFVARPLSRATGLPLEDTEDAVNTAMWGLRPTPGAMGKPAMVTPFRESPPPVKPQPNGPLNTTLTEGQATGDLGKIQLENAARSGELGNKAQKHASRFDEQQKGEVTAAGEDVRKSLDNHGNVIVDNPQQAGELIRNTVQSAKQAEKASVDAKYQSAKDAGGELSSGALEGVGQKIKGDLYYHESGPIVVDERTPSATAAINDLDNRVTRLYVKNKANPFNPMDPKFFRYETEIGQKPGRESIQGLSLSALDEMRKRLVGFRRSAFDNAHQNPNDARATKAIVDSFDKHIDDAIRNGSFTGDHSAVQAWWDAREAHGVYKSKFHNEGAGDTVGKVVERITGRGNTPEAIGNDVADFMYGSSGVNPNTLNVAVVDHLKKTFGADHPAMSAARQGLFSRLTEAPTGPGGEMVPLSSANIAKNINKFLNGGGTEMSRTLLTPEQRQLWQSYADLHQKLVIPARGNNWSGSGARIVPALQKIGKKVGMAVGAMIGRATMPTAPPLVSEALGAGAARSIAAIGDRAQYNLVRKQMPIMADAMRDYVKAKRTADKANVPLNTAALATAKANLLRIGSVFGVEAGDLD